MTQGDRMGENRISRKEFFKKMADSMVEGVFTLTKEYAGIAGALAVGASRSQGPKIARVDVGRCLAWSGMSCQLCYLACPLREGALYMQDLKPVVNASLCDGCGQCATACVTVNDVGAMVMTDKKGV